MADQNKLIDKPLYNALRSNDAQAITKIFETASKHNISKMYNQMLLRNIPLSPEVRLLVESKLIDLQFLQNKPNEYHNENTFENVKNHLTFLCDLIENFLETYHSIAHIQFLYHLRHIAQHMAVVKRELEFSYKTLPWEEMQFYLCLYLYNEPNQEITDVIFKLFINRTKVCNYLNLFWQKLYNVKKDFSESDLKTKKINRSLMRESIIANCSEFKSLLDDFLLLRNIYSLNKITCYINKALEVDVADHGIIAYLVIERALQVAGEYLKNTPDSPNLSEHLYKYLLRCSPRNLKNILTNLRNMLSHSFSLNRKINIEESEFFIKIQHDLKKIKNDILYVLYVQKIEALKTFLERVLELENIELNKILTPIDVQEVEGFDASDFQKTKELILVFCQHVLKDSDEDSDTINELMNSLNKYEHKNFTISSAYLTTISELSELFNGHQDLKMIKRMIRTHLSMLSAQEPYNLHQEVFLKIRQVADNFKKRRNYDPDDFQNPDDKSNNINTMLNEIYNYIRWRLPKIKWMEEMESTLVFKEEKAEKELQVEEILRLVQEKVLTKDIQVAINKSRQVHLAKSALMAYKNLTTEQFQDNLKKLYITSKRQAEILQHYTKDKHDKITTAIKQINDSYGTFLKNLPDIFPIAKYKEIITEFYKSIQLKKTLFVEVSDAIQLVVEDQVKQCYSARLDGLKILLTNQPNKLEMVALEMLILDLMELLENLRLLHDNKALVVEEPVILMGKQVRNMLAHGDLLMDILPGNSFNFVLSHGKKLLEIGLNILEVSDVIIGLKTKYPCFSYKKQFQDNVEIIVNQAKLFEAVKAGDINGFNEVVHQGADILGLDSNGRSIIDIAICSQDPAMLNHLENVVFDECSLLKLAQGGTVINFENIQAKDLPLLQNLSVNDRLKNVDSSRHTDFKIPYKVVGLESENWYKQFEHVIRHGELDAVKYFLIYKHAFSIDQKTKALNLAAKYGYLHIVKYLMKSFYSHINKDSLLKTASVYGHYEIIQELSNNDTNVLPKDLIHLAAKHGHDELVTFLLNNKNIDVNLLDNELRTPLHWASYNNHSNVGKVLLSKGCKVNLQDGQGMTPLHLAIRYGCVDMSEMLLNFEADFEVKALKGQTVLHLAAQNGSCELIKTLIKRYRII